jgi:hypothetical protein
MPIIHDEESPDRASGSIMAVAVAQFVGSVGLLVPSGFFLAEELQLHHSYPSTYRALHPAVYLYYIILPISFSLLGILTSIGLSFLREWARKSTLLLATIPAAVYGEVLILRPPSVFPPRVGDIYLDAVAGALCLWIPLSIWWLILFTRPGVKAQFQSRKAIRP